MGRFGPATRQTTEEVDNSLRVRRQRQGMQPAQLMQKRSSRDTFVHLVTHTARLLHMYSVHLRNGTFRHTRFQRRRFEVRISRQVASQRG